MRSYENLRTETLVEALGLHQGNFSIDPVVVETYRKLALQLNRGAE